MIESPIQAFSFDTVDSTNEVAKRLIGEGRIRGRAYLAAREQTAGKGQRGRVWISPRDAGIYLSIVDRPGAAGTELTLYTLAAGVGCVEAIRHATGADIALRPINDVYAQGRKLGGILTEAVIQRQEVFAIITGIGINIRRADRRVEDATISPISLQDLLPVEQFAYLDVKELVTAVVRNVLHWNVFASRGDSQTVRRAWNRYRFPADSPILTRMSSGL